jgi:hypothetical protein
MDERIASLTPEQAEHALNSFYEQLPAEAFTGGKPSLADLADVTERVAEEAPADLKPLLEVVVESAEESKRGEFAKLVLDRFNQEPGLRPYVDEALRRAAMPHMALPLIYPAVIIALAIIPSKMEFDKKGRLKKIEWNQLDKTANLVKALTGFVKALPSGVWSWLTGK